MVSPVLLITFNRPEHTRRVLTEVLRQYPRNVFVFQDAPREGIEEDVARCAGVKAVIDELTTDVPQDALFYP